MSTEGVYANVEQLMRTVSQGPPEEQAPLPPARPKPRGQGSLDDPQGPPPPENHEPFPPPPPPLCRPRNEEDHPPPPPPLPTQLPPQLPSQPPPQLPSQPPPQLPSQPPPQLPSQPPPQLPSQPPPQLPSQPPPQLPSQPPPQPQQPPPQKPSPASAAAPLYGANVYSSDPAVAKAGLQRLTGGMVATVFSLKRRPEVMQLQALPGLSMLQCLRTLRDPPEISVDLSRVQEVRCGRHGNDFERFPEEANRENNALCVVIFYGVEALPQALSLAVKKREDFELLVVALRQLVDIARSHTYQEMRQRWFRRQFHGIVGAVPGRQSEEKVSIKQFRTWLLKHSVKVSKKVILPILQQLCLGDSLRYGGFMSVVTELMRAPLVKKKLMNYVIVKEGVQCITPGTFLKFLKTEQNEKEATEDDASRLMDMYWEGNSTRDSKTTMMDLTEFEDFLFSPLNSVWSPEFNCVHQDMTRPLTDYWIASSHNTYLVGNQVSDPSSEEMYARCLRMGCRCLELDCWDGPDGVPEITHGFTLTSKIKVSDVLKVIKANAWQTSEYPIVLSIENHLSLDQQRTMARMMQDIFKDELLTEPIDPKETQMPSPEQLKRKIIIKDKKLKTGSSVVDDGQGRITNGKTGTLRMLDREDNKWYPFTVGLTETSFFFTNDKRDDDDDDAEEDIDYDEFFDDYDSDEDEDELNDQPWFYGDIPKNEVRSLLKPGGSESMRQASKPNAMKRTPLKAPLQDGSFLVRHGGNGGYSLSFIWEGDLKHVRVKTREDEGDGRTLYTFGNEVWKGSITELVKYFKNHRLYIANENTHLYLDKPVCKPHPHIDEPWYQPHLNRPRAEALLLRIPQEGVFLVRGSSEPGCLSLTFRHKRKISHFQIGRRGRSYLCGCYRFQSLPKLVEYFRRRPLYRKTKLTVAASLDIAGECQDEDCDLYGEVVYNDPSEIEEFKKVSVRALYDFIGQEGENEMTFTRGATITNVKVEDKAWWKGDYMQQKQCAFPASYVQVMEDNSAKRLSGGDQSKGKEDTLELKDCKIDNGPYLENNRTLYCFRLEHPSYGPALQFGCESLLQLEEWVLSIREAMARMEDWHKEKVRKEKDQKRALQLSNLVVYCQAVSYDPVGTKRHNYVSSLEEVKITPSDEALLMTSRQQFLRVYPKMTRIKSSNYDPVPVWLIGAQMVALNYQTPDLPMQLNQARFITNGGCGYVLKPNFMRESIYSMNDILTVKVPTEVLFLSVTVIAGRNLCSSGRTMKVVRPFVVLEVIGLPQDNRNQRTKGVDEDNGLNPAWSEETHKFDVSCPEVAFLRLEVLSEVNDSKTTIAQGTFPVTGLRQGYRSVPLKNVFSENLEMSSLLVYIELKSPKDAEEANLSRVVAELRRYRAELLASDKAADKRSELLKTEQKILEYLQTRRDSDVSRSAR